ncbi:MAG: AMP-binding protein [Gammaproteobacteria bacterium]|nr:AMP-binding protein [Gammaproteobacteria bacterium]
MANHAAGRPQAIAYVIAETAQSVTYGQLNARSNALANTFYEHGLRPGDGVALLMENRLGLFELCLAAQRSGLYYTPVSTHLKAEEISYILNDCGAKVFVASAQYAKEAQKLTGRMLRSMQCFSLGGDIPGLQPLEPYFAVASQPVLHEPKAGSSMLYSSGTTGYPKGIRRALTGGPFDAPPPRLHAMAARYGFDRNSVYLSPAPLYHAAPLGYSTAVLGFGGMVVVMQRFDAERALALIEHYKVTHSQWVPTMFIRMLRLDEATRARYRLDTHKVAIHAAAPCPVAVKQAMIEWWGPVIFEYYAGSEGVGSTFITSEEWLRKPGSVGRSVDGALHIVGEDGEELETGGVGTIYFEDAPAFEYHNAADKTAAAFTGQGWGTLGDVGYVDDDGYLYLTDRRADLILSGGVNIYPQEAENLLLGHPKVLDAAVFGVPNEEFGEEVKAVVQVAAGVVPDADLAVELIDYCKARLSSIKCPRSIDFDDDMPRLPNGKLYKRVLRDKYRRTQ